MQRDGDSIRLSASDLMRFAGCAHATALDLDHLLGRGPEPVEDSEDAMLLQKRGDDHEAAYLECLRAAGDVVEVSRDQPFEAAIDHTITALRDGARVVFQGALAGGMWGGWSDFLERVETPSGLGDFSYEVADTKLKRKPAPSHVLQLVLYSDLLALIQGKAPEVAHVILGDGSRFSFRLDEVADYARAMRNRLEAFVADPGNTRPVPVRGCDLCRWRENCADVWEVEDSLFRVAGISKTQVAKIEAAGITTMRGLAEFDGDIARLANPTRDRLQIQARLQTARPVRGPHHELRPAEPGRGFALLPPPDPEDLFYDIEGDPLYEERGIEGLEYLHGVWAKGRFTSHWAHDHAAERFALARLFDQFAEVLDTNPGAHVYHYAAYEVTGLKRLAMRHGLGEERLDHWLREGRFVDLYAVVRGGVFASEPSYSIKDMEALYGFERTGDVTTAGGSVVAYEKWIETGDAAILDEIEHYNRLDCVSTEELRNWLISIRPEMLPEPDVLDIPEESDDHDAEIEALRDNLLSADLPEGRGQLLFDLARYHPREKKPAAWAVFEAAGQETSDLCEDPECLGGLVATGPASPEKRSLARAYRWPPQETKVTAGKSVCLLDPEAVLPPTVTVLAFDREARTITLKTGNGEFLRDRLDLLPSWAIGTGPIEAAIGSVIADQMGEAQNTAADDLLARAHPRLRDGAGLPDLSGTDTVTATIAAVRALDGSVLPIQGPPGTGKTYVTARAILALVRDGKRVGVCSNSHDAIRNVLMGCVDALEDEDVPITLEDVTLAHKEKVGMEPLDPRYNAIRRTKDDGGADVVGGTAWLFSSPDLTDAFDTIFVDEAGQVPLANALALTRVARNLVLVGDPNQLPQVVQGSHPEPAHLSCLQWMLGDDTVVPPDRGLFLPVTRRMHPDLTAYISPPVFTRGALKPMPTPHGKQ